jgi:hypothetical protein
MRSNPNFVGLLGAWFIPPSVSFTLALVAYAWRRSSESWSARDMRWDADAIQCACRTPSCLPLNRNHIFSLTNTNLVHTTLIQCHSQYRVYGSCERVQHRGAGLADLFIRALKDRLALRHFRLGRDQRPGRSPVLQPCQPRAHARYTGHAR